MASVDSNALGTKRTVRPAPRIDMTPMVDLGFLLITFFIFTTSMSQDKAMKLVMPKGEPDNNVPQSGTLSLLLSDKGVYAYRGTWAEARRANRVLPTTLATYTGVGEAIRQLQRQLRAGKSGFGMTLLIKPARSAGYSQVIDALDQALIHEVKTYAIVDADAEEEAFLAGRQ